MSNTVSVEAAEACQNMNNNYFFMLIFVGGKTLRKIIKVSGAQVELNRNTPESWPIKCFIIRGIKNKIWFRGKLFFFLLFIESLY